MANAIQTALPDIEILLVEDKANLPYGTKPPERLYQLVLPLLKNMESKGCQVIVIACNTVTTTIIDRLRQEISIPLVGMEPMVKPAAQQTQSGTIAVCATPATLASKRYKWLKNKYAKNVKVLEPDCSNWAKLIEDRAIDRANIEKQIESVCQAGADVIVLGCTHYHWIESIVQSVARDRAEILQSEQPAIDQLKKVLIQLS